MGLPACGGIKLDSTTLSTVEGVICESGTLIVDPNTAVSACGGVQWDGDNFKVIYVDNKPIITFCPEEEPISGAMILQANCGVGVDKRFFNLTSTGALSLISGYLLKVNVTPTDAVITVLDSSSQTITPISGTTNQYIANGNVSVTVQKDGYQGKSQTINMNANKEVNVTIYPAVDLTVNVTTPASGYTIVVKDSDNNTISPKQGTTNVFDVEDTQAYTVTVSADGYTSNVQQVIMDGDKTITVALQPV